MNTEECLRQIELEFVPIAKKMGLRFVDRAFGDTGNAYALYESNSLKVRLVIDRLEPNVDISWLPNRWRDMSLIIDAIKGTSPRQMWSVTDQLGFIDSSFSSVLARIESDPIEFEEDLKKLAKVRRASG